jgi:hypothetical protein
MAKAIPIGTGISSDLVLISSSGGCWRGFDKLIEDTDKASKGVFDD